MPLFLAIETRPSCISWWWGGEFRYVPSAACVNRRLVNIVDYAHARCFYDPTLTGIQKDSILEGKVCIEHVISWWRTRSCAEKGARDRMSMAVIVLSHYNLNNWAFVVVRYDPMICCVLHARVHPAERHQPTLPPSPWLLARKSSKRLALVYTMRNSRAHVSRDWHASLSTEFRHAVARVAEQHRNK